MHSVPMEAKCFTEEHLKLTKKYINTDVWPQFFHNPTIKENFPGLKYISRKIIQIKDVVFDPDEKLIEKYPAIMRGWFQRNHFQVQLSRAHGRGLNHEKVWESLRNKGYELCHIPMSVCLLPDGKIWLMNGRTRMEELVKNDFTNIIADYYESVDYLSFDTFSLFSNPPEESRSPQTMEDVVHVGIEELKDGKLKPKDVYSFVQTVTGGAYTSPIIGKLVQRILAGKDSTSIPFTDKEAVTWLKNNGYHDNVNENGIYYFVSSKESAGSSVLASAKYLKKLTDAGNKVKELRVIISPGVLYGASAEDSWKKKIDNFRNLFSQNFDIIKNGYFKEYELRNVIKVYGAIPSVYALAQEYPMDKLVIFMGKLKYKTFQELVMETSLEKMFDMEVEEEV